MNEESIAEINEKKRYNPSLLELKPNVNIGAPPTHPQHNSHHHHQPPFYQYPTHNSQQAYQPMKFRPAVGIKDFKPSYQMNQGEVVIYNQTPQPIKLKKTEPKKVKLMTPGLKHYATSGPKYIARNDYANYFRSRHAQEEQRDASHRIVQNMYRRNPRAHLVPQYAPDALNYGQF